jgi:serine/threonine protein kinase
MQEVTQIAERWRRMQGAVIEERYRLINCPSTTDDQARFTAESDEHGPVTVLIAGAGLQYEATGLEHPNLLRVLHTGRTEVEGEWLSFAVTEPIDETLGEVLAERALTPDETREVLGEVLNSLGWLHAHGVAHGNVSPANIAAVGNTIKLSGALRQAEHGHVGTPYDPPEAGVTPAGDVWSLGMTMFEALTRRLPSEAADLAMLPPPFRGVAENTLVSDPSERWSVDRISGYLSSSSAIDPAPVTEPGHALPSETETRPPAARKWVYAALAVAAISVILVALWPAGEDRAPPSAPTQAPAASSPAAATQAPPPPPLTPQPDKPSPYETPAQSKPVAAAPVQETRQDAAREERQFWRVIVYTFSQREHARQRAESINRRFPQYEAEVFQPNDNSPYLVSIGGRMSRQDAAQLRAAARESGLPRDAYIQNYSH